MYIILYSSAKCSYWSTIKFFLIKFVFQQIRGSSRAVRKWQSMIIDRLVPLLDFQDNRNTAAAVAPQMNWWRGMQGKIIRWVKNYCNYIFGKRTWCFLNFFRHLLQGLYGIRELAYSATIRENKRIHFRWKRVRKHTREPSLLYLLCVCVYVYSLIDSRAPTIVALS